ncbi:DUF6328 family protein [Sinomonas sp. JGH33]|uniref:DUF6328 family protein n=1 Tax=Sinomonas terricola TaxID=3110330 RepID=A0ABU5T9U6_9MICC|nr:DUF6328 family protein [Sinomonas sp. JGH33]MEA5456444.1 DUF6328 family protein [Sinomonas sp. JGH33]
MPSGTTDRPSVSGGRGTRYVLYHRRETYAEKLDRNWGEILQELRILQTGLQLIAGFLLTLPFQSRFSSLDEYQRWLYLGTVLTAAVALAVVLMPLSVHRWLFRRQVKNRLVASGAWAAKTGLGLAAALLVGTASLIFDVVVGRWQSWVVAGALAALCAIMFLAVPAVVSHTPEPALLPEPEAIRRGPDQPGDGIVIEAGMGPEDD